MRRMTCHGSSRHCIGARPRATDTPAALGALRVDEGKLRNHVDEVVRSSVEETLNGLLDAEADQICRAQRYERTAERVDGRAGHYERKLETKAGQVSLKVPKERRIPQTRLEVRYSPTLAMAMIDALPYMVDYPYGCTEQTLNRFLPTVIT